MSPPASACCYVSRCDLGRCFLETELALEVLVLVPSAGLVGGVDDELSDVVRAAWGDLPRVVDNYCKDTLISSVVMLFEEFPLTKLPLVNIDVAQQLEAIDRPLERSGQTRVDELPELELDGLGDRPGSQIDDAGVGEGREAVVDDVAGDQEGDGKDYLGDVGGYSLAFGLLGDDVVFHG